MNTEERIQVLHDANLDLAGQLVHLKNEYDQLQKAYLGLLDNCGNQIADGQRKEAELVMMERQLAEADRQLHEEREINRYLKARLMALSHEIHPVIAPPAGSGEPEAEDEAEAPVERQGTEAT